MSNIPFLLEVAAVLATFAHPNHIVCLCSWGLTHLPPTCNSKLFGYNSGTVARKINSPAVSGEKLSKNLHRLHGVNPAIIIALNAIVCKYYCHITRSLFRRVRDLASRGITP